MFSSNPVGLTSELLLMVSLFEIIVFGWKVLSPFIDSLDSCSDASCVLQTSSVSHEYSCSVASFVLQLLSVFLTFFTKSHSIACFNYDGAFKWKVLGFFIMKV